MFPVPKRDLCGFTQLPGERATHIASRLDLLKAEES
ncbi:hypothetical protein Anas_08485 [Armadillidium nasatum]|uniref:Uncharacterized protein n=1 Tax=Armadillidium nasatum TaxID=96803 RepID=A0A5N5SSL9_9CRUS|nr:hypothetical protein Anas_08485 [Armadillidium nasatum]